MAEKQMRIRGLVLHGSDLSYIREILTKQRDPSGKEFGLWLRHDNENLTKEQADVLVKENGWEIVDAKAPALVPFVAPPPPVKPDKVKKPE